MALKDLIAKWLFKNKVEAIMGKIIAALSGWKTYITAALGIIVAVIGHYWGPLNIAGIDIPFMTGEAMWQVIWAAVTAIFLRQGVSKSGPVAPA